MTSIAQRFASLRGRGRKAFVPYLMSGFPDRSRFLELARDLLQHGADLLEIGAPFTDPLADGPVIQAAGQQSLEQGTNLTRTLEDVETLSREFPDVPLILMSYLNPMRAFGLVELAERCQRAGIRGWIVPDRDLDRPQQVLKPASSQGVDVIPLLAPTTPARRIPTVLRGARGFAYLVSVTGVTGTTQRQDADLDAYIRRVRERTDLPLCVGFGVATGEQARAAARQAEGVIVGSALLAPFLNRTYAAARQEMVSLVQDIRSNLGPT